MCMRTDLMAICSWRSEVSHLLRISTPVTLDHAVGSYDCVMRMQYRMPVQDVINKHDESKVDLTSGGRVPQTGSIECSVKIPYNAELARNGRRGSVALAG
jgi:hypothetical protein